jgi:hypothetical protein
MDRDEQRSVEKDLPVVDRVSPIVSKIQILDRIRGNHIRRRIVVRTVKNRFVEKWLRLAAFNSDLGVVGQVHKRAIVRKNCGVRTIRQIHDRVIRNDVVGGRNLNS